VTLPATLPGLRSGIVVVFLMVSTAYVSATLLGGRRVQTNGMIVFQEALQLLNQPKAAALAMLMLVASIVVSALVGLVIGRMTPWLSGRPARARAGASPRLSRALTRLIEGAGPLVAVTLRWLALALLLFPLVLVVVSSFNDSPQATSAQFVGFTLKWYALVFDNIRYMDAFWLSLWLALATVAVSLVLTIPAAFALARHPFPGRDALAAWFMLPLALPNIAIGLGMLRLLQWFIEIEPFLGLLAVHVVLVAPFMLAMLRASVIAIDRGQEEAAASLGAKPLAVFLRASLPQIVPGITSAAIIGFLVSFGEVTVTAFLTSPRLQTLPVRIYAEATFSLENTVNAVSTMIIVVTVILLLVVDRFVKLDRVWKR
jgi:putative spermidine/putrescine transport system permease protein